MNYKCEIEHEGRVRTFTGDTQTSVFIKVKIFLNKNNIKFSDDMIYRRITSYSKPVKPKSLSLNDIITGAHAILRYTSGTAASNKEVARRTDICLGCPMRSSTSGCGPCGFSRRIATFINGIRAKKKSEAIIDSKIKQSYCGVCNCSIPMMVLTRYEDFYQESPEKNNKRPDNCWLKQSSPNFTNE